MESIPPSKAAAPLVLALDVGSTTTRAGVFDAGGRLVEGLAAAAPTVLRGDPDGQNTADPDALLDGLFSCIDRVLADAGDMARSIKAVGGCSFVSNLMAVDRDARPMTRLSTYADLSSAGEAEFLRRELDEERFRQRTGCRFHPSYAAPRLLHLKRHRPEVFRSAARFVTLGEYLELTLFGKARASFSAASWSGLLDSRELRWDEELLGRLELTPSLFSPLADLDEPCTGLADGWHTRWPALANIPWFPLMGDGAAANVGTGCASPERVAVTLGTTSAVRAVTPGAPGMLPKALWRYRLDRERSLPGGALTEGGSLPAWMREVLRLGAPEDVEREVASMKPCSHGLTVLPLMAGERAPGWSGKANGAVLGMTLATRPVEIFRAGLESVAQRLYMVLEELAAVLPGRFTVVAGGGALRASSAWRRILTDAVGREVLFPDVEEPSMRGAALMALEALGVVRDVADLPVPEGTALAPDAGAHALHLEAVERQRALYAQVIANA
ncbi:Glycerol kinase [Fundidesulfovibrio magnetotacticus]|uniref:Glycerol kinase n=1 Tax=Fundidesulfovibrio magnetotacticus TaxID=2730080 RepID=A0A6V8M056_9BACT|nr:gluconokinase [Fundidesulfovibrio magnetotacticus]GFK95848.1 Glycerol kinase [Fundidesulfovibrio magnetotacticus]